VGKQEVKPRHLGGQPHLGCPIFATVYPHVSRINSIEWTAQILLKNFRLNSPSTRRDYFCVIFSNTLRSKARCDRAKGRQTCFPSGSQSSYSFCAAVIVAKQVRQMESKDPSCFACADNRRSAYRPSHQPLRRDLQRTGAQTGMMVTLAQCKKLRHLCKQMQPIFAGWHPT